MGSTGRDSPARKKEVGVGTSPARTPCWRTCQRVVLRTKTDSPMEGEGDSQGTLGLRCACAARVGAAVSVALEGQARSWGSLRACWGAGEMRRRTRPMRRWATSATAAVIELPSVWRRSRRWAGWRGGLHVGRQDPPSQLTKTAALRSTLQCAFSYTPSTSRRVRTTAPALSRRAETHFWFRSEREGESTWHRAWRLLYLSRCFMSKYFLGEYFYECVHLT